VSEVLSRRHLRDCSRRLGLRSKVEMELLGLWTAALALKSSNFPRDLAQQNSPSSLGGSFLSRNSLFAKRAVRVVYESHVPLLPVAKLPVCQEDSEGRL
jgi:hypothetical protein